jgi:hypothetical protein
MGFRVYACLARLGDLQVAVVGRSRHQSGESQGCDRDTSNKTACGVLCVSDKGAKMHRCYIAG